MGVRGEREYESPDHHRMSWTPVTPEKFATSLCTNIVGRFVITDQIQIKFSLSKYQVIKRNELKTLIEL